MKIWATVWRIKLWFLHNEFHYHLQVKVFKELEEVMQNLLVSIYEMSVKSIALLSVNILRIQQCCTSLRKIMYWGNEMSHSVGCCYLHKYFILNHKMLLCVLGISSQDCSHATLNDYKKIFVVKWEKLKMFFVEIVLWWT